MASWGTGFSRGCAVLFGQGMAWGQRQRDQRVAKTRGTLHGVALRERDSVVPPASADRGLHWAELGPSVV